MMRPVVNTGGFWARARGINRSDKAKQRNREQDGFCHRISKASSMVGLGFSSSAGWSLMLSRMASLPFMARASKANKSSKSTIQPEKVYTEVH